MKSLGVGPRKLWISRSRGFPGGASSKEKVKVKAAQSCPTLWDPMDRSPWNSPGQNTGVGNFSLLQEISPTQD